MKNKDVRYYMSKMVELANKYGVNITNDDGDVLIPAEDEVFRPCWADTPERRDLPKYWFLSNHGNLVAVTEHKITVRELNEREDGSYFINFKIRTGDEIHTKNVQFHNLMALVWGSERFGRVDDLLAEKGLYAFGGNNKDMPVVQGHHINANKKDNSPDNIQLLVDDTHMLMRKVPKPDAAEVKTESFLKEFSAEMAADSPNRISVIMTGQTVKDGKWTDTGERKIVNKDGLYLSERASNELDLILAGVREALGYGQ